MGVISPCGWPRFCHLWVIASSLQKEPLLSICKLNLLFLYIHKVYRVLSLNFSGVYPCQAHKYISFEGHILNAMSVYFNFCLINLFMSLTNVSWKSFFCDQSLRTDDLSHTWDEHRLLLSSLRASLSPVQWLFDAIRMHSSPQATKETDPRYSLTFSKGRQKQKLKGT